MLYFMKIRPVGDKLCADWRTDRHEEGNSRFFTILWKCLKMRQNLVFGFMIIFTAPFHDLLWRQTNFSSANSSVVPDRLTDLRSNLSACQSRASLTVMITSTPTSCITHRYKLSSGWYVQPSPRLNGPSVRVTSSHTLRPINRIIIRPPAVHSVSGTVASWMNTADRATKLLRTASPLLPDYTASHPKFSRPKNYSSVPKWSTGCHKTSQMFTSLTVGLSIYFFVFLITVAFLYACGERD